MPSLRMAALVSSSSTGSDDGIKEVTSKFGAASIRDPVEAEISILSWNTKGDANKDSRVKVTNATFQSVPMYTSLDLICFQELTFNPSPDVDDGCSIRRNRNRASEYFTELDMSKYGVGKIKEDVGNLYESVIFKKETFSEYRVECVVSEAFCLMKLKKKFYDKISKNDDTVKLYVTGKRSVDDVQRILHQEENLSDDLCRDILSECKEIGNVRSFKEKLLPRYKAQSDGPSAKLRSPEDILKRRAAMVLLKLKSREFYFLVISVHVPRKRTKGAPAEEGQDPVALRYAYLFFDFLEKLELVDLPRNMCVLIAGDFNIDIKVEPGLRKFLDKYECPSYPLDELRPKKKPSMIDFILCRKFGAGVSLIPHLTEVRALPLCCPDALTIAERRKVTNHNPLCAKVQIRKRAA